MTKIIPTEGEVLPAECPNNTTTCLAVFGVIYVSALGGRALALCEYGSKYVSALGGAGRAEAGQVRSIPRAHALGLAPVKGRCHNSGRPQHCGGLSPAFRKLPSLGCASAAAML